MTKKRACICKLSRPLVVVLQQKPELVVLYHKQLVHFTTKNSLEYASVYASVWTSSRTNSAIAVMPSGTRDNCWKSGTVPEILGQLEPMWPTKYSTCWYQASKRSPPLSVQRIAGWLTIQCPRMRVSFELWTYLLGRVEIVLNMDKSQSPGCNVSVTVNSRSTSSNMGVRIGGVSITPLPSGTGTVNRLPFVNPTPHAQPLGGVIVQPLHLSATRVSAQQRLTY